MSCMYQTLTLLVFAAQFSGRITNRYIRYNKKAVDTEKVRKRHLTRKSKKYRHITIFAATEKGGTIFAGRPLYHCGTDCVWRLLEAIQFLVNDISRSGDFRERAGDSSGSMEIGRGEREKLTRERNISGKDWDTQCWSRKSVIGSEELANINGCLVA